ncbi:shikimate kinase [Actinomyces slackii]|uniref:Shikimate kinase n=1 Tax=Actinomyces slackii TaxID=52774 RepID=A0A448KEG5_9ACTO|nr:shikimate kinase [Actinomyces slackii]
MTTAAGIILTGPPGAGCSSVGRALAELTGSPLADLAELTADALGVEPGTALVAVPEPDYRRTESATALLALEQVLAQGAVLALGSGCLGDETVRSALIQARDRGARIIALGAPIRVLTSRNGLDAPRSVALGPVHHQFTQMLRAREAACRDVAETVISTASTSPEQTAAAIIGLLGA